MWYLLFSTRTEFSTPRTEFSTCYSVRVPDLGLHERAQYDTFLCDWCDESYMWDTCEGMGTQ
jgi:hypothetical protein